MLADGGGPTVIALSGFVILMILVAQWLIADVKQWLRRRSEARRLAAIVKDEQQKE